MLRFPCRHWIWDTRSNTISPQLFFFSIAPLRNTNNNHFNINRRKFFPFAGELFSIELSQMFSSCEKNGKININYEKKTLLIGSGKSVVSFFTVSDSFSSSCFDIVSTGERTLKKKYTRGNDLSSSHYTFHLSLSSSRISIKFDCELEKAIFIMLRKK